MNKFFWFDRVNQVYQLEGVDKILSTHDLRLFFEKQTGKVPKSLNSLPQLEAACRELRIPGARKITTLEYYPKGYSLINERPHKQKTRLIEIDEILRLKSEGKTDAEIARIAGVSRQNIFQILRRKKTTFAKTNQKV